MKAVLLPSWMAPKAVQRMAGEVVRVFERETGEYMAYLRGLLRGRGS